MKEVITLDKDATLEKLTEFCRILLELDPDDEFDDSMDFSEMGFSSQTIVVFVDGINSHLNLDLPAHIVFDYSTLDELSDLILEETGGVMEIEVEQEAVAQ